MDVHDKATRSYNMSRIGSRDTKPELRLRKLLWQRGLRGYRVHAKLPGKPDLAWGRGKVAVFVDGCFWHGCPSCGDGRAPVSNTTYWDGKRLMNQQRDERRTRELEAMGWRVLRLWEHEVLKETVKSAKRVEQLLARARRGR
jgi:DNA mismatch endonuclease (patch repair protein)